MASLWDIQAPVDVDDLVCEQYHELETVGYEPNKRFWKCSQRGNVDSHSPEPKTKLVANMRFAPWT